MIPFKTILITSCPDKMMWYAKFVGCEVPYHHEKPEEDIIWSREPAGHTNIVKRSDCRIIEHRAPVPCYLPSPMMESIQTDPSEPHPVVHRRTGYRLIGELSVDEIKCLIEYCSRCEDEHVGDRNYTAAEQMKNRGRFFTTALEKDNGSNQN